MTSHPVIAPIKPDAQRARQLVAGWRYLAAETLGHRGVGVYAVRSMPAAKVALRHNSLDKHVFDEIFVERIYAEPPEVARALAALGRPPTVADLGANVGFFAAWAAATHPGAQITCVEPDPANVAVLRATAAANGARWDIWPAAAATQDGTVGFAAGLHATSHVAAETSPGTIRVPARDALELIVGADLVKIDVEGAEWPLLLDPRFTSTRARAIALEYHPDGCPEPDARDCARRLLGDAGFEMADVPTLSAPPGYGSLWAWR